jgi:methionyl-tRNA synthetase
VNRSVSFAARTSARSPAPASFTGTDRDILERSRRSFGVVGGELERSHFKAAITEAMRTVAEANKYMSDQAPWKLRESDPERMRTVMHVVLQLVDDAKTLLTPFLPALVGEGARDARRAGRCGRGAAAPGGRGGRRALATGDHRRLFQPRPLGECAGPARLPLSRPGAAVRQADTSVIDEELARLERS